MSVNQSIITTTFIIMQVLGHNGILFGRKGKLNCKVIFIQRLFLFLLNQYIHSINTFLPIVFELSQLMSSIVRFLGYFVVSGVFCSSSMTLLFLLLFVLKLSCFSGIFLGTCQDTKATRIHDVIHLQSHTMLLSIENPIDTYPLALAVIANLRVSSVVPFDHMAATSQLSPVQPFGCRRHPAETPQPLRSICQQRIEINVQNEQIKRLCLLRTDKLPINTDLISGAFGGLDIWLTFYFVYSLLHHYMVS